MDYCNKIPSSYSLLHILEKADDWIAFKEIIKIDPEFLKNHLNITSYIFDYNYLKLSKEQQDELFEN